MSLVNNQVSVFEAYRGGKIYFLVVCGTVLVFILAEDEIAGEIMSFPQIMLSLESRALLLVALPLLVHPGWVGATSSFYMVTLGPGCCGLRQPLRDFCPGMFLPAPLAGFTLRQSMK